jgi:hypothetical protein
LADAGQPVHLTARQLLRDPPDLPVRDRSVFVCENPTVVAEAASRFGARAAPLVCANVHPGAAATWDPRLTEAMLEVGVKVEEERVLGDLLADLAG